MPADPATAGGRGGSHRSQWFDDAAPAVAHACNAAVSLLEAKGLKVVEIQVGPSFCLLPLVVAGLLVAGLAPVDVFSACLRSSGLTQSAAASGVPGVAAVGCGTTPVWPSVPLQPPCPQLPELALLRVAHSCTIASEMRNNMCGERRCAATARRCTATCTLAACAAAGARCSRPSPRSPARPRLPPPRAAAALQDPASRRRMNAETRVSLAVASGFQAAHYLNAQKVRTRIDRHFRCGRGGGEGGAGGSADRGRG